MLIEGERLVASNKFKFEKTDNYKKYVVQLENQYQTTFQKLELYINGSAKLNDEEKNKCLLQILDTFLSGQEGGRSVAAITGSNLKNYCDNMIYGETIYIYKASRVYNTILGALFYISFMQFFIRFCNVAFSKRSGSIFQQMDFGIGDGILFLAYICIPQLIAVITRNYFENPVRCKRVKRYTYYGVWLLTIGVYTFLRDAFKSYEIMISFSNVVLIFIFLIIADFVIYYFAKTFEDGQVTFTKTLENEKLTDNRKLQDKYNSFLNAKYEKHKESCRKRNRAALNWNEFIKKNMRTNVVFTLLFFIYGIVFLGLTVLSGRGMLINGADAAGIIILLICCFGDLVMLGVVKEGIRRNRQLTQRYND